MSQYEVVYTTRPNSWKIKSIYSLQYTCGLTGIETVRQFINKYAGNHDDVSKVYTNKNKCVGVMATDMNTGEIRLHGLRTKDWIVIYRYRDGGYDIFALSDTMWQKLFRVSKC